MATTPAPGLRERKKRRTRETITGCARHLFVEKGYDGTSLAEIAEAAEVAVSTIFVYFASKSDIFFAGYDDVVDDFIATIESRPAGCDAISASIDWNAKVRWPSHSSRPAAEAQWRLDLRCIVNRSPSLQAMERARYLRAEVALRDAVASDLGDQSGDPRPSFIAAAHTTLMFSAASFARERGGSSWESLRVYADACLRATTRAIESVEIPPGLEVVNPAPRASAGSRAV